MASRHQLLLLGAPALLLVLLAASSASASAVEPRVGAGIRKLSEYGGAGRKVGGRTEVNDVEGNREVQELGRFCVEEQNRRRDCCGGGRLEFGRVVAAQRQVVSGLKYYLRVAAVVEGARNGGDDHSVFDAVVVVKPWLESRTLLRFAPAVATPNE